MCGIYGIYNYKQNNLTSTDLVRMGDVLNRRGPDDRGSYADETVMLGHNRLSILDLSANGRQPMSNEDGSVWVTFNGEIYNFKELKASLRDSHQFKSKTDTEVLIHCYEEMGEDMWNRLEGMFSFCLWDRKNRAFYLVRDHYGIKPLYYAESNGSLVFASQIKGILALPFFVPRYNHQSISNFLSYFYVPGPETIVRDIVHLPPGSFLKMTGNDIAITSFSRLRFNINYSLKEKEVLGEIKERIREGVKKSIISDVPVGLLLSGGIDSNILLSEMSDIYPGKISTFTLGVNETSYNEGDYAREIAELYNSTHYEEYLSIDNFDRMLSDIVTAVDCLNANPGLIMMYQYLQLASRHVKVAISGAGGDELFAGYPTYLADLIHSYFKFTPSFIRKMFLKGARFLGVSYKKYSYDYVLRRFLEGSFYSREKAHYWWRNIFTDDEKVKLLNPDLVSDDKIIIDSSYKYIEKFGELEEDFENRALYADFHLFLSNNALVLLDHLSMHFSLEVRPPLLYQRFVDYSLTIPYHFKFKPFRTKYILRKAYEGRLTRNVTRRKKHGVVAPLGIIFKNHLKTYVQDQLSAERLNKIDIFNVEYVQELVRKHLDGLENNGFKLWCILCLLKWHDIFYRKKS